MKTMHERFDEWFDLKESSSNPEYPITTGELKNFIEQELTKKDQEHKAELEMIAKKMKKKSRIQTTIGRDEDYEVTVINLKDAISILDSHINKL